MENNFPLVKIPLCRGQNQNSKFLLHAFGQASNLTLLDEYVVKISKNLDSLNAFYEKDYYCNFIVIICKIMYLIIVLKIKFD